MPIMAAFVTRISLTLHRLRRIIILTEADTSVDSHTTTEELYNMPKTSSDFLTHAEGSSDLKKKMSKAKSSDELVKLASASGYEADKSTLSHAMRTAATLELQRRGFPEWAINSIFLGEAVCW